jgi:hypothetical protein
MENNGKKTVIEILAQLYITGNALIICLCLIITSSLLIIAGCNKTAQSKILKTENQICPRTQAIQEYQKRNSKNTTEKTTRKLTKEHITENSGTEVNQTINQPVQRDWLYYPRTLWQWILDDIAPIKQPEKTLMPEPSVYPIDYPPQITFTPMPTPEAKTEKTIWQRIKDLFKKNVNDTETENETLTQPQLCYELTNIGTLANPENVCKNPPDENYKKYLQNKRNKGA